MIMIFANVLTNSSVSYFLKKVGRSKLLSQASLWIFVTAVLGAVIFSFLGDRAIVVPLFVVAVLFGFITCHSALYIGGQKVPYYNLITLLQPLLLLCFMWMLHLVKPGIGYFAYFYSQIVSMLIVLIACEIFTVKFFGKFHWDLNRSTFLQSLNFGWQVELSALLQFFNYRLSFYLLQYFVGIDSVGLFSVGVTISEAIWIFSRSISLVQYSNVIKDGDTRNSYEETLTVSKYSLYASLACIAIILLLPASLFGFIFGDGFTEVKTVILLMSPGILFIAVSNVFGNYFSAIGRLKVLILKSAIGLIVTLILALTLIPRYEITGACIVNTGSYVVSSVVLFVYFFSRKSKPRNS